jgi:hypothetical protein
MDSRCGREILCDSKLLDLATFQLKVEYLNLKTEQKGIYSGKPNLFLQHT